MQEKLFAFAYCLIFLNPLHLENEIWPYYAFFAFSARYGYLNIVIIVCYISAVLIASLIRISIPIIDMIQVLVVIQSCFYISKLNAVQIERVRYIFKFFLLLLLIVGFAQFKFINVQDFTYSLFSGRPSLADHLINERKVVTLLAPEPAYAATHILSIFFFLMYSRTINLFEFIVFLALMLMTRSVSSLLILPFVFVFGVATNRLPLKYLLGLICAFAIPVVYYLEHFEILFSRTLNFVKYFREYGSVLSAEAELGSVRIGQIVNTSLTLFNDNYVKPFSFLGAISITTYSIGFILVAPLICFFILQAPMVTITGVVILLLSGPVLLCLIVASVLLMAIENVKLKRSISRMQLTNKIAEP